MRQVLFAVADKDASFFEDYLNQAEKRIRYLTGELKRAGLLTIDTTTSGDWLRLGVLALTAEGRAFVERARDDQAWHLAGREIIREAARLTIRRVADALKTQAK